MKIAIPVKDDTLTFLGNAGHAPMFALYDMNGGGMFRSFNLNTITKNPRTDVDFDDENHTCAHDDANEAQHVAQHDKMGAVLNECDYIVLTRACKNTAKTMNDHNVKIVKYTGAATKAQAILQDVAAQFK